MLIIYIQKERRVTKIPVNDPDKKLSTAFIWHSLGPAQMNL